MAESVPSAASTLSSARTDVPAAFHVMAKPSGAICNLDCTYCFFLSKEMLYPGDRFRMADATLETYIRQTLESHRDPEVVLAFQGGEPTLLGIDFYVRAIEHARHALPEAISASSSPCRPTASSSTPSGPSS
jgi:sulfatase maturation enzyme AslB (radical SAM superfamily)